MTNALIIQGEGAGRVMTAQETHELKEAMLEATIRGLNFYASELNNQKLLSSKAVAEELGVGLPAVKQIRTKGELYVRRFDLDVIKEVCAARPDARTSLEPLLAFIKQGETVAFPAWQIRPKEEQLSLFPDSRLRPEITLARQAHHAYKQELAEEIRRIPPSAKSQTVPLAGKARPRKTPSDDRLSVFFERTGGLSDMPLADYIVEQSKLDPPRPVTLQQLTKAWWYHENPFGGFS